jgi:hypothetical protein
MVDTRAVLGVLEKIESYAPARNRNPDSPGHGLVVPTDLFRLQLCLVDERKMSTL